MHHASSRYAFQRGYSALSYVWGSKDENCQILINGHLFEVRKNLWDFLNTAREFSPSKVFWIDAICIDQNNIEEKGLQVQKMGSIYYQANEVLAWLGPATPELAYVMEKIPTYSKTNWESMLTASAENKKFLKGFKQIQDSKYWTRAWTVQEFLLPRCGSIMAGKHSVKIDDFASLLRCFQQSRSGEDRSVKSSREALVILAGDNLEKALQALNHWTFYHKRWLLLTKDRHCEDIRDRVHAVLSLKEGHGLRVSYSINPFYLYLEALWLGQPRDPNVKTDQHPVIRADAARELANMLEITPASVLLYSRLKPASELDKRTKRLHLRAAASLMSRERWLNALNYLPGSHSFLPTDHWASSHPLSRRLRDTDGSHIFPRRLPPPIDLESTTNPDDDHRGFRLILTTIYEHQNRPPEHIQPKAPVYDMDDWAFLQREYAWCLMSGIYHTQFAEEPRRVYYMLVDQSKPEWDSLIRSQED